MSRLSAVTIPKLASLSIGLDAPASVTLRGTIASQDPAAELGGFLRRVHDATMADKIPILSVDVSQLTFVNSSAIRLFVDWATWVKASGAYRLRFLTSRNITWQKTSFMALSAIAKESLIVDQVA